METDIVIEFRIIFVKLVDITSSPQGDGNTCLDSCFRIDKDFVDITSSPQGDGNWNSRRSLNSPSVVDITSSPQGDGNPLSICVTTVRWAELTLHLPRKGMETKCLVVPLVSFTSCWHYIFPARGWKLDLDNLHLTLLSQVDITSSPQGDGNVTCTCHVCHTV